MYLPPAFLEDDLATLHATIRGVGLATLISVAEGCAVVSHIPLVLCADEGPYGTLYGHVAKANPHGAVLNATGRATAVFLAADAYVHPGWYPGKAAHGKVVPTWNYVAVEAEGPVRMIDDPVALRALVATLTAQHEAAMPTPWRVDDAPAAYLASQLKGITGFALTIARIEGKWKLSQNRTPDDRAGVIDGLRSEGGVAQDAVADLMDGK